jgi:hypothetical protein
MPGKLKQQRAERLARKHRNVEKVVARLFTQVEDIQLAAEDIEWDQERTHLLNVSKAIAGLADAREAREAMQR